MIFIVKGRFHADAQAVGAFTASGAIAYFAGCILLKRIADRLGPRLSMTLMNLGTAAAFALFLLFPSLGSAFACYIGYSFLCGLFWPPLMYWLSAGIEGSQLSRATSTFSLAWSSGGIFAPYLGGILLEMDLDLPLYVGIAICAVFAFLIFSLRKIAPDPAKAEAAAAATDVKDRSSRLRFPAWIGLFLVYALLSIFTNIFPLFAKDELGLSESRIGLVLLTRALFAALGFWLLGRFEFWHFRKRFIVIASLLLLALDLSFLPLKSALGFSLGLAALGLIQALCYNSSIFYGASGARDKSKRMTIHESLLTAGQIFGSIAGGFMYQQLSWSSVFLLLAAFIGAGFAAQILILRAKA
jgi:DHA1 family multidrug resistance protein-like MFS transporter/DHA1 family quinolone resistance protein-like MFS transporter